MVIPVINNSIRNFAELALNEEINYGSFIYELIKYNMYFPNILSTLDKCEIISSDNPNITSLFCDYA